MKSTHFSRTMVFFFLLAMVLILAGIILGTRTFAQFEALAELMDMSAQLTDGIENIALKTMLCGSLAVSGVGIMVICFLHMIRRTARIEKEAAALEAKNKAMEELNKKTQELAHHQRLETLGTLTSSIAHEFNNLLTPIMGYSLMALEKLEPEEELYDDILEIYQSSRKAKEIISRLSDLSRKNTASTFRQASPDELVRKTLDVAMPAKPEQVELKLDLNCWEQRFTVNEIQIQQLLLNLILNGFQAMEESGGVLTIDTSFDEDNIRIQVTDTGCGIPKENLNKVFEPFFTTKETGRGTGLGLAIAAQVVEDHKGTIRIRSRLGEGTRITVSLPRNHLTENSR